MLVLPICLKIEVAIVSLGLEVTELELKEHLNSLVSSDLIVLLHPENLAEFHLD